MFQQRRKPKYAYVCVFLLALGARLYLISSESMYSDEGFSLYLIRMTVPDLITQTANDVHPPLYYLLLKAWTAISGDSLASLRSFSAIFGALAVTIIVAITYRLGDWPAASIATVLASFSVYHIDLSQATRMYSLLSALLFLTLYFFIVALSSGTRRSTVIWVCCAILASYTHIWGAISLSAVPVLLVLSYKFGYIKLKRLRQQMIGIILVGLAYLPWLPVLYQQATGTVATKDYWLSSPTIYDIYFWAISYLNYTDWMGLFITLVAISSILKYVLSQEDYEVSVILLSTWAAVPLLIGVIISITMFPVVHERFLVGLFPVVYAIAGLLTSGVISFISNNIRFPTKVVRSVAVFSVIVLLIGFSAPALADFYTTPEHTNVRGATNEIASGSEPAVVTVPPYFARPVRYHLNQTDEETQVIEYHGPESVPTQYRSFQVLTENQPVPPELNQTHVSYCVSQRQTGFGWELVTYTRC